MNNVYIKILSFFLTIITLVIFVFLTFVFGDIKELFLYLALFGVIFTILYLFCCFFYYLLHSLLVKVVPEYKTSLNNILSLIGKFSSIMFPVILLLFFSIGTIYFTPLYFKDLYIWNVEGRKAEAVVIDCHSAGLINHTRRTSSCISKLEYINEKGNKIIVNNHKITRIGSLPDDGSKISIYYKDTDYYNINSNQIGVEIFFFGILYIIFSYIIYLGYSNRIMWIYTILRRV